MANFSSWQFRRAGLRIETLEQRYMLSVTPTGDAVLINDFVAREQTAINSSAVVAASASNAVIVFEGKGASDRQGVFAEVLDADGQTTVPSFQVNSTARGQQYAPAVAMNSDGGFVVAWAGRGVGDKRGVFFQQFSSTSAAIGSETLVNETSGGKQSEPAIAVAPDGSFTVAWSGVGKGDVTGVFLRRFDADGNALAGEELVNTTTADQQMSPSISFDATGNLFVAWQSRHQDGSDWGIYSQRFDSTGGRLGSETQLNTTTTSSQSNVTLASNPQGGVVAAWQSHGQDGDSWSVVARGFDDSGEATGAEVLLNDGQTTGHQRDVSLAVADDGQWLAAWTSGTSDGAGWEAIARSIEADGTLNEIMVLSSSASGTDSGHQESSGIATLDDTALAVWSGRGTEDRRGVYSQSYDVLLIDDGPQEAPDLAPISDQMAEVNTQLEIPITATDPNSRNTLTFTLDQDNSPKTATIEKTDDGSAVIRWTPTPLEANQTVLFRVLVTDDGNPPLTDSEDFSVTVGDSAPASLTAFALALADANARFLGAAWNQTTTDQRELFEDGGQLLPFTDITGTNRVLNMEAENNGITSSDQPVWIFADGTRLEGVQSLQRIAQAAGINIPASDAPFIAEIPTETLLVGSPLHVPLDGYDPNGGELTYTVTTNNSGVTGEILNGNRSARIDVAGYGDLVFELFEQRANRATDRVIELAEDPNGFYQGIIFHRVLNNFVIQGGDPLGTGGGGSSLPDFDDQFHVDLQHNRSGLLSYAKGPDDSNDSQFFITEGTSVNLRNLDFNHTIFGILTEGELNRAAISDIPVMRQSATNPEISRPTFDVTMNDVEIFEDRENATLLLRAAAGTSGPVSVTVTATDPQNNTFQRTFTVNVSNDLDTLASGTNGRPFFDNDALNALIPDTIPANTATQIQLANNIVTDVEGDPFVFAAVRSGTVNYGLTATSDGLLTITPPSGFTGPLEVEIRVRRLTPINSSDFDAQLVSIEVI